MIKITSKCSMNCSHCMNDATANGKHMDFDTFKKVVLFQNKYGSPLCMITGGEPSEHPEFKAFLEYAVQNMPYTFITVATNGLWMTIDPDFVNYCMTRYSIRILFQVSHDPRYYPIPIDLSLPVFRLPNVAVINNIPKLYPQGRALENNMSWEAKGSKCFNVRAVANQVEVKSLAHIIGILAVKEKICTPHIAIDGSIKLGESDLCPPCSHIDKSHDDIMQDILNFKCQNCNHVNCNLEPQYKQLIGES